MIQGNDLKVDVSYSSLKLPVKISESKEENIKSKAKINDLFKQPNVKTSDSVPSKEVLFYISEENENSGTNSVQNLVEDIPEESVVENQVISNKKEDLVYKTITKTQTAVTVAETIANLTGQENIKNIVKSSSGVLTASKALIDLDKANESENSTKTVISSLSSVASGVGTVLSVVDIPEAQFLTFTGKVLNLGVEQQDLNENIKKKDARGIVGTSVSMVKGGWGVVVSGLETAKLASSLGNKAGIVSTATVGKITTTSAKISKVADKIAIPFAVAGTALNAWDLKNDYDKVQTKKKEIEKLKKENEEIPEIIRMETPEEEQLNKELKTLNTNMTFRGVSFGLSAISTAALIVSVAYPPASSVANVITLGGNIASGIAGTLSKEDKRESALNIYENVKDKYDKFESKVDKFIFAFKKK